jgi:hypothetical protein
MVKWLTAQHCAMPDDNRELSNSEDYLVR